MSFSVVIGLGRLIVAGTGGAVLALQGAFHVQDQKTFLQVIDKLLFPCLLFSELGKFASKASLLFLFLFVPLSVIFFISLRELLAYLFSHLAQMQSLLSRKLVLTLSPSTSTSMIPLILVPPFLASFREVGALEEEIGHTFCYVIMFHAYYDSITFFLQRYWFPHEKTEEELNLSPFRQFRRAMGMTLSARMMAIGAGLVVGLVPPLHTLVFPKGQESILGFCTSSLGIASIPALAVLTGGTLFWCGKSFFVDIEDTEEEKAFFDEFHKEAVTVASVNLFFTPGIVILILFVVSRARIDPFFMLAMMIESITPLTTEMCIFASETKFKGIQRRMNWHVIAQYLLFLPTCFLWLSLYRSFGIFSIL